MAEDGRAPLIHVHFTHAGPVCPGKRIPSGIPSNFGLLQAAQEHLHPTKEEKEHPDFESILSQKTNLGEVDYKAFYDDLTILNEGEWADFFRHPHNYKVMVIAHDVVYMLAGIHFKREAYESCGEVLEKSAEIMRICKQHCSRPNFPYMRMHIPECDRCEYKIKILRSSLNMQLNRYKANIPLYRDACAFEAKYPDAPPLSCYNQPHLFWLHKSRGSAIDCIPTAEEIYAFPDEAILRCMEEYQLKRIAQPNEKKEAQLMVCIHCNKQESALGEFQICPRCNDAVYCGKVCQKASWKLHKKVCGKKE